MQHLRTKYENEDKGLLLAFMVFVAVVFGIIRIHLTLRGIDTFPARIVAAYKAFAHIHTGAALGLWAGYPRTGYGLIALLMSLLEVACFAVSRL